MKIFLALLKILLLLILFALFTFLTQVGGMILLLSFLTHKFINNRTESKLWRGFFKTSSFLVLYFIVSFGVLPFVAKAFHRVPMPVFSEAHVKPLRLLGCIFNRHYVQPEVRSAVIETAAHMQKESPGVVIQYLDGSFPSFNYFPLWPHLSHGDGKKLDIAFHYLDAHTKKPVQDGPSFSGYGIGEDPRPGEINWPLKCGTEGYWQYNIISAIIPQGSRKNFIFDSTTTALLINSFAASQTIDKLFLEPHLKIRLKTGSPKIRFHGCQAVRHDDHLHIQMK